MPVPIYLVVGCPGSGKSWVCERVGDFFEHVDHDKVVHNSPPGTYATKLIEAAQRAASNRPILGEVPFSMSEIVDPIKASISASGPICVFIREPQSVIQQRYHLRTGHKMPQGHLTRQTTFLKRALEMNAFIGTSAQVQAHLVEVGQQWQAAQVPQPAPVWPEAVQPLRAMTYRPVAVGLCTRCSKHPLELVFVYNPYGDDFLMCVACGAAWTSEFCEMAEVADG